MSTASPPSTPSDAPAYPAIFSEVDDLAVRGQHRAIQLTRADIALVLLAGIASAAPSFIANQYWQWLFTLVAVLLLLATLLDKGVINWLHARQDWFAGRAIAENTKTLTWLYMMRAFPFDCPDNEADARFAESINDALQEIPLHRALSSSLCTITDGMRRVRDLPPDNRRRYYLETRLLDQLAYYQTKVQHHKNAARVWSRLGLAARGATVLFAAVRFLSLLPGSHMASLAPPTAGLVAIFTTLAVAITAWSQLIRHDDLVAGYTRSAQALMKDREILEGACSEAQVEAAVRRVEDAMNREHTIWTAKHL